MNFEHEYKEYEFNINNPRNILKYDNKILEDLKIGEIFHISSKRTDEKGELDIKNIIGALKLINIDETGLLKFECKIFNEEYYDLIFKKNKYKITPGGLGRFDTIIEITYFSITMSDNIKLKILSNAAKILEKDVKDINKLNNELIKLIHITNSPEIKNILSALLVKDISENSDYNKIKKYEDTLKKIIEWKLPETGKFHDEAKTQPVSYAYEYGSRGERDYFRTLAIEALKD